MVHLASSPEVQIHVYIEQWLKVASNGEASGRLKLELTFGLQFEALSQKLITKMKNCEEDMNV